MRPPAPLATLGLACLLLVASLAARATELPRVVSLNPSLTAILLAIDAEGSLVGVDDWSARDLPAVRHLPKVGGLFNPSVEGILALAPDVVVWVPSAQQRNLRERLEALGVDVMELENITLEQVLASIEALGERVGRGEAAHERVRAISRMWTRSEAAARQREHPRAVMVLQRDPLYVVGGGSFLDSMLRAAGAQNLAAEFEDPYPRVGVEWLIAAGPELILDAAPNAQEATTHWARWPSIGAAVVQVPAEVVTLPGPHLDRALDWLRASVAEWSGTSPAAP